MDVYVVEMRCPRCGDVETYVCINSERAQRLRDREEKTWCCDCQLSGYIEKKEVL